MRADHHTYFVGDIDWSFSLWAHNRSCGEFLDLMEQTGVLKSGERHALNTPEFEAIYNRVVLEHGPNRAAALISEALGRDVPLLAQSALQVGGINPAEVFAPFRQHIQGELKTFPLPHSADRAAAVALI